MQLFSLRVIDVIAVMYCWWIRLPVETIFQGLNSDPVLIHRMHPAMPRASFRNVSSDLRQARRRHPARRDRVRELLAPKRALWRQWKWKRIPWGSRRWDERRKRVRSRGGSEKCNWDSRNMAGGSAARIGTWWWFTTERSDPHNPGFLLFTREKKKWTGLPEATLSQRGQALGPASFQPRRRADTTSLTFRTINLPKSVGVGLQWMVEDLLFPNLPEGAGDLAFGG